MGNGFANMFEFFENAQFFYFKRNNKNFKDYVNLIKANLSDSLDFGLKDLINDIGILLEGKENMHYEKAFKRYNKYYKGFDNDQLRDYARYLSETFDITIHKHIKKEELPF